MNVIVSRWGNSLVIGIPVMIAETLGLQAGDQVSLELKDWGLFIKKKLNTSQMFEQFYDKPFAEIAEDDIGPAYEIDWGEDIGDEII